MSSSSIPPAISDFERGVFDAAPTVIMSFFRDAYGEGFNEELARRFLARARVITLRDKAGKLAAAAAVNLHRITLIAATPAPEHKILRLSLVIAVATACHDIGHAGWTTVGESYPAMNYLYKKAGMKRVTDLDRAVSILAEINAPDTRFAEDEEGLLVTVAGSLSDHEGYRQKIYAWPDYTPEIV